MHYIKLALLLSFGFSVRCTPIQAYRDHEALVKMYPCGDPQPRVMELLEVVGEDLLREKTNGFTEKINPAVTILHRCYSSGCCSHPNEKCTPVETEDVTLTFLISGESLKYLEVPAVNHTRCGCQ